MNSETMNERAVSDGTMRALNDGLQVVPLARSHVYGFLARAFADPSKTSIQRLRDQWPLLESSLEVLAEAEALAAARVWKGVSGQPEAATVQNSYRRCFGHGISKECPPYEAEYGQAHVFQKSQCLADIAGFYRAFGLDVAPDFHDRADHISAELDFMQWLCRKEARARSNRNEVHVACCEGAQAAFLRDHLGRWILSFARRVQTAAPDSFHAGAAALLGAFIRAEVEALGIEPALDAPLNEDGSATRREDGCASCALMESPTAAEGGLST